MFSCRTLGAQTEENAVILEKTHGALLVSDDYFKSILARFLCLFVCLLEQNPKNYTPPPVGREVNPLGVITHGQRHPRAYQRQCHKPRTCQSMFKTLQVDRLAHIPGLTPALYKTHPQPPKWFWTGGGVKL